MAGGGRGRDLGAPSQEANRCSPSGVSQMADIKKSLGGGGRGPAVAAAGAEKDENIPQDEQATESCTFLFPPCFDCDSPGFILFLQLFRDGGTLPGTSAESGREDSAGCD